MKRDIVNSCIQLEGHRELPLTDGVWEQCKFRVRSGGLGLDHLEDIQYSAYAASWIECIESVDKSFANVNLYEAILANHPGIRSFVDFQYAVRAINQHTAAHFDLQNTFDFVRQLKLATSPRKETLQHYLSELLAGPRFDAFTLSITDHHRLAWFTSINDDNSGLWLTAIPKTPAMTFSNKEMVIALRYRLFLP